MTLTPHGSVAELARNQTFDGNYPSPEDLIREALDVLMRQRIDAEIARGLADVEAGRYIKLTDDNMDEIAEDGKIIDGIFDARLRSVAAKM
uniref:Antitoxin ParD1/3/4 n=1 Tax=Candidatus Kentrum sp. SD TaxID=2126332 RepID=A0A450YHG7_9GAMM|nr:MAG: hypothetical protein BECKSD772F_GA0070984_10781 [Candidatus Kentron sp. SD]VFK49426.1 MAG: hypothetical protein BECKSD772E_GA0070983_11791 [Candidatus Kentron sp. SD]VFK80128.1 MAG: hypothetical protein BECKSD772D_GA0070982_10871 [Candidatus Kentron sp. SD]